MFVMLSQNSGGLVPVYFFQFVQKHQLNKDNFIFFQLQLLWAIFFKKSTILKTFSFLSNDFHI